MLSRSRASRPRQPAPAFRRMLQCLADVQPAGHGSSTAPRMGFHTERQRSSRAPAGCCFAAAVAARGPPPPRCCRTAAFAQPRPFASTSAQRRPDRQQGAVPDAAAAAAAPRLPDLDKVVSLVNGARDRLLSHPGVPSEEETATALRVCAEAADLIMDASVQPQLSSLDHQADTAASTLLSLDGRRGGAAAAAAASAAAKTAAAAGRSSAPPASSAAPSARLRHVVDQISDAAYAMADEPRVFLTPALLEQYVHIQARLGRPESLPHVLHLYAAKPAPTPTSGRSASTVTYRAQNPRRAASAVDADVAAVALDAALAAKNLDAAVGVVEHTFAAPAFVRAKLLRRGLLPGFVVVGVPLATWTLASQLAAQYQNTMDTATATGLSFAAILAYIGFTGTIGVVANTTANDQMRRVTWAPGTPLRERWLREEERAALDTVACAFGFREAHRYGEEEGAAFQALREYILRKGMLLDQVELMEGMSS